MISLRRIGLALTLLPAVLPIDGMAQEEESLPLPASDTDNPFGLTPDEASALLQKIMNARDGFSGSKEQVLSSALTRISTAAQSESAAAEFYLAAWKVVNIDRRPVAEGDKPPGDDWQKNLITRMKDTGSPRALRLQLAWLALTLEAAQADMLDDYVPRARSLSMEAVKLAKEVAEEEASSAPKNGNKRKGGGRAAQSGIRRILTESVMDSIFAEAYNLQNFVKPAANWALAPMDLKQVYQAMTLSHYRAVDPSELAEAWDEFIASEAALQKVDRDDSAFLAWTLNQGRNLQWAKHLDLLKSGAGGKAAGDELIRLVSENPTHPSLGEWMKDLEEVMQIIKGEF